MLAFISLEASTALCQFVPFVGSKVTNSANQPFTGTMTACPVTSPIPSASANQPARAGLPLSYRVGGGGTATAACFPIQVTNGSFASMLPDVALTNPAYPCFALSAPDPTTFLEDLPDHLCVQPSEQASSNAVKSGWCTATGCNLDLYAPQLPNQAQIQVGPTGPRGSPGPPGDTTFGRVIEATTQTGSDCGAQIQVADGMLGAGPGTIRVSQACTVATAATLSSQHYLELAAPVSFTAPVTLPSSSGVLCHSAASLLTLSVGPFLAPGSDGVSIDNCWATAADPTQPKLFLLTGSPVSDLRMHGNYLREVLLFYTAGAPNSSQRLSFGGDIDVVTNFTGNQAAINLFFAQGVVATGETFIGTGHGIQWWGGNANLGWIPPGGAYTDSTQTMVNAAGSMAFSGIDCGNINGACIWGSMGRNISVSDVTCNGTGDMCVDAEGSVHVTFSHVTAKNYGNFCAAVFFQSLDVTFDDLNCDGGSTNFNILFALKHSGGTTGPNHENVRLINSNLRCYTTCEGVYSEGHSHLVVENDHFFDATIANVNYSYNADFLNDEFTFDSGAGGAITAIMLPTALGGSTVNVKHLRVFNSTGTITPGSLGIGVTWSDFNAIENYNFDDVEVQGFATDLATANAGTNVGPTAYPRMVTNIRGSYFHDGTVTHTLGAGGGSNDTYNFFPDNRKDVPGTSNIKPLYGVLMPNNMDERVSGASGTTAGAVGSTVSTTLALPLALGDSDAFANGQYLPTCTIMATSGAPQVIAASLPDTGHITVVTQAIIATPSAGQITCRITH